MTTAHLRELIPRLPSNVYVQRITVEACRIYENDIPRTETQMFRTKQTYPNLYVPGQTLVFSTPLWNNGSRFDMSNDWENFVKELDGVDTLCNKFDFQNNDHELTDTPISDRLYIKDIILLELPVEEPNYHERPYYPQSDDDKFYDGVRCSFSTFKGTYQLLGDATEEQRDGWLPGMTRKPMDLQFIEVVKTKHIRRIRGKRSLKAFHHGKDDIYRETKEDLVNHPERVRIWLPTLLKNKLIIWRKETGDWKESTSFVAEEISLKTMLDEGEEMEISKEERDKILGSMINDEDKSKLETPDNDELMEDSA